MHPWLSNIRVLVFLMKVYPEMRFGNMEFIIYYFQFQIFYLILIIFKIFNTKIEGFNTRLSNLNDISMPAFA